MFNKITIKNLFTAIHF